MGCTSAKQVSSVPNSEEEQNKAHSNGDIVPGMYPIVSFILELVVFLWVRLK